jgi:outer membrane receptor protein involved in Fe transport
MKTNRHTMLATSLLAGLTALAPQVAHAADTDAAADGPVTTGGASHVALFVAAQGAGQAAAAAKSNCPDGSTPVNGACPNAVKEVVVTGSRIPRTRTTTDQPVEVITKQDVDDRAFANLADAINSLPGAGAGVTPIGPQNSFGTGRNYIDLFGLGSTHTLTLVNGLRFVGDNPNNFFANTSGGNQVDLNVLPTLFLDHIDTVYATGAAVYGTDAVAGVVNVELTKHFVGEEFIAQGGISTYADIPRYTVEGAIGHDFNVFGHRLNIAVDFQYDKTNALNENDRPWLSQGLGFVYNPNAGSPGQPNQIVVPGLRYPSVTPGGVPFMQDNYTPLTLDGTPNGKIVQFANNGNLVPENIGPLYNGGYTYGNSSGGDGLNLAKLTSLQTPLNRKVFTGMINYDFSDHVHWNTYVFYSDNVAVETVNQPNYNAVFFGASPACNQPQGSSGSLLICPDNAFINSQAASVLALNGLGPNAAGGPQPFYLSRQNTDITPDPISSYVHTLNITSTLSGDFDTLNRNFAWNVSVEHGSAYSFFHEEGIIYGAPAGTLLNGTPYAATPNLFGNSLDSVLVGGTPECRIKAQNPTSTNPVIQNCVPFDPFGASNPGNKAANAYFTGAFDDKGLNTQDDIVANIGTRIVKLPAGDMRIELGYEHRDDEASFTPNLNAQEGVGNSVPIDPSAAGYHTNEYYTEVRAPILGRDFQFPLAYRLDLDGAYRDVESSQAGTNKAWSYGAEYQPVRDLTLRYSRSKTFAAPTLGEAFSPLTSAYDFATDPCTTGNITQGPNPTARAKNCATALTALGVNPATFTSDPSSSASVPVTSGGNPGLKNEIGNSFTYGLVAQPRFVPGLTLTANYIEVNITNAIEYFGLSAEAAECYDNTTYPTSVCSSFTRNPTTGFITGGAEQYINAGYQRFSAYNYALTYDRSINQIPGIGLVPFVHTASDLGRISANVNVVNIRSYTNSVTGALADQYQNAGTIGTPHWRWQAVFNYYRGPVRVGWVTHYIGPSLYSTTTTIANQYPYQIKENMTHDASIAYKITPNLRVQFNVNNIFNTPPPSPVGTYSVGYYDFIGRYFLMSLRGKF